MSSSASVPKTSSAHMILDETSALELVGVHGYEGIAQGVTREAKLETANAYLRDLQRVAHAVAALCPNAAPFLVTAGGSEYFDRVVDLLGAKALSGCQLEVWYHRKRRPVGSVDGRNKQAARAEAISVWRSLPEGKAINPNVLHCSRPGRVRQGRWPDGRAAYPRPGCG